MSQDQYKSIQYTQLGYSVEKNTNVHNQNNWTEPDFIFNPNGLKGRMTASLWMEEIHNALTAINPPIVYKLNIRSKL